MGVLLFVFMCMCVCACVCDVEIKGATGDLFLPLFKLLSRPFKAVVIVPHDRVWRPVLELRKIYIELCIRGGDNNDLWFVGS